VPIPSEAPAVSILTKVRHAVPELFAATARSVAAQTFTDFEWVILESPPYGCVAEVLANSGLPRVRHVRLPDAPTLAAGRNAAVAASRGALLAILDADDECAPTRLASQVAFLAAHPEIAVVGGVLQVIDDAGRGLGYRAYPNEHEAIAVAMRRHNAMAQPAVMLRRSAFEAVGGYREYGEGACEDYELWSRLMQNGHRFANLREVVLRYRIHPGGNKTQRMRATLRDTLRVKREYWRAQFTLGDHCRALGERVLLNLPASWVLGTFLRRTLRSSPPGSNE
jgi:glycosyltransferase involved in cell wall biosynthesis